MMEKAVRDQLHSQRGVVVGNMWTKSQREDE